MITNETQDKVNEALESLATVSEAATTDTKAARKRKKQRAKKLAAAEHALSVIRNATKDKDSNDDHIIIQNSPPDSMLAPEPTPVVSKEPAVAEEVPPPAPVADEEPEATPALAPPDTSESDELQRKLDEANEEAKAAKEALAEAQRKLDDCEQSKESVQADAPTSVSIPVVEKKPEPGSTKITIVERATPSNWGWLAWLLAIIGLILGWAVVGEWFEVQSQPSLWDWVAWCFRPVSAAVGFFGGGLIGHFLAEKRKRPVVA